MEFKENLKNLRKQEKKTQNELAIYLGIAQSSYQNYEAGLAEPSISNLMKIADCLNVTLDYLVGREFSNPVGYLTENQATFVNTFLALNEHNQMRTVIYVADLLANQH